MLLFFFCPCIIVHVPQEILRGQLGAEGVGHLQNLRRIWRKRCEEDYSSRHQGQILQTRVPSLLLLQASRVSITIFPRVLRDTF